MEDIETDVNDLEKGFELEEIVLEGKEREKIDEQEERSSKSQDLANQFLSTSISLDKNLNPKTVKEGNVEAFKRKMNSVFDKELLNLSLEDHLFKSSKKLSCIRMHFSSKFLNQLLFATRVAISKHIYYF